MDRYQRVEKQKVDSPMNENEIRITSQGLIRNYLTYATSLLQEKRVNDIVLKAMGHAISKTVTISEILKSKIIGLHQDITISSMSITDVWEPIEEGLLPVEITRHVSMISITLSLNELKNDSPGYQAPAEADQSKPQYQPQQANKALLPYNAYSEDSYGRGRRRGGGRGRGRGGYENKGGYHGKYQESYQEDYQDNEGGYSNWGSGRGRSYGHHGAGYQGNKGGYGGGINGEGRNDGYSGGVDERYGRRRGGFRGGRGGGYGEGRDEGYGGGRDDGYGGRGGGYGGGRYDGHRGGRGDKYGGDRGHGYGGGGDDSFEGGRGNGYEGSRGGYGRGYGRGRGRMGNGGR